MILINNRANLNEFFKYQLINEETKKSQFKLFHQMFSRQPRQLL